jgi:hypothetical protein
MNRSTIVQLRESTDAKIRKRAQSLLTDLIAFLRKSLGPAASTSVTLFDDEPAFPDFLNEGTGTVRIDGNDPFVGEVSLPVTPRQRFSPRIDGWEFRIREKPGPGEFCCLRFAWNTADGQGIMLEFADD